jgi:hypothetical protein
MSDDDYYSPTSPSYSPEQIDENKDDENGNNAPAADLPRAPPDRFIGMPYHELIEAHRQELLGRFPEGHFPAADFPHDLNPGRLPGWQYADYIDVRRVQLETEAQARRVLQEADNAMVEPEIVVPADVALGPIAPVANENGDVDPQEDADEQTHQEVQAEMSEQCMSL